MLTLEGITYRVGKLTILADLSLAVGATEIVSLLGPSGSGKTSVLRVAMGLVIPQHGTIRFNHTVLGENGAVQIPPDKRPFAFLFQNFTLFPHLNVKRNILIGLRHLPRQEREDRLDRYTGLLRIQHLTNREIHDLSGGEQQRVALARTLALHPNLLLLDEPFSNLDKMTKYELYHDIKNLIREEGMAAILATHDQEEAFYFSDRLAVMRQGGIVAEDEPHALYDCPKTEWLARFTGDAHILTGAEIEAHFMNFASDAQNRDARFVIRPEQIIPIRDSKHPRVQISETAYYGFYSLITLQSKCGVRLSAAMTGAHDFRVGESVALQLLGKPARLNA